MRSMVLIVPMRALPRLLIRYVALGILCGCPVWVIPGYCRGSVLGRFCAGVMCHSREWRLCSVCVVLFFRAVGHLEIAM